MRDVQVSIANGDLCIIIHFKCFMDQFNVIVKYHVLFLVTVHFLMGIL